MPKNKNQIVKPRKAEPPCPLTRSEFLVSAKELTFELHGKTFAATPKDMPPDKDGRCGFGWHGASTNAIMFDDVPVPVRISVKVTCVGSKEAAP